MRWPIQLQLLVPMLSVVVAAIVLASGVSAYFGGLRARQTQEDSLRRVVATLTEAPFPLNEWVLRQVGGLSGAEFVLLDQQGSLQAATLELSRDDLQRLQDIGSNDPSGKQPAIALGGRSYLSQRLPVAAHEPASRAGSLVVLDPEDLWSAVMRQAAYPAITTGAVATLAVVLITTILAHRFVQPIRRLSGRAAAIARGDFQPLPLPPNDDEIRDLAISINRMSEQLGQYEDQVRCHERLRTLGQLAAGVTHQLRNAATGARMAIELHERQCAPAANNEELNVALRQLRLMESYLQRFMSLGREQPVAAEEVCLSSVVEDALSLVRPACAHAGVHLDFTSPTQPLRLQGDREGLRQLTINLVLNALEAVTIHGDRPPRIRVELDRVDGDRAVLCVRDTGPGPRPEIAEQLFEPFVTGKPEGTGLGLYVARHVVDRHHGSIHWRRDGDETCFVAELPVESSGATVGLPNPVLATAGQASSGTQSDS